MNTMNIDIYVNERYNGSLRYKYSRIIPPTEEEIKEEVEKQLATFKNNEIPNSNIITWKTTNRNTKKHYLS